MAQTNPAAVATTTTTTTTTTTILRVKRPRSVDSVPTLQFSGKKRARTVQDLAEQLASTDISNESSSAAAAKVSTSPPSLVWKRVGTSNSATNKRSFKYVDATLNPINDSTKRQRLELTLEQPSSSGSNALSPGSKKRKNKSIILNPISRLIADNLKKVQEGSATLQTYLTFLEQDQRVRHDPQHFLSFALPGDGSNVLHLAALWNCVEEARHILIKYPATIPLILDSPDGSGQRPYQIAMLTGNDQVGAVLEAFGADTHDYVYDVFELLVTEEQQEKKQENSTPEATVVELHGGVGYVNELGELVFEALRPEDYGQDSDKEDADADDDVDSNAEDHEFNDYPEEEEDDEDVSDEDTTGFRHYNAVFAPQGTVMTQPAARPGPQPGPYYPDVNDEETAEYDAQYGLYDGSDGGGEDGDDGTQRFYAYDPEFDD